MKRLLSFSVLCFALAIAPPTYSQTVVIPAGFDNVEGNSGGDNTALGNFSNTGQVVYNESLLAAAGLNPGDVITGLSFRLNSVDNVPIWSVDDYIFRLGTSTNSAGNLDPDFTVNRGSDFVTVRNGPVSYDGTEYDASSEAPGLAENDPDFVPGVSSLIPNAFGEEFTFNVNTFTYNGGDLLLEYTHSLIDTTLNSPGVQQTGRADGVINFEGVQSQFSRDFDTTMDGFDGFGVGFAPIIQFSLAPAGELVGDFNDDDAVDCLDIDEYIGNLDSPATGGLEDQDLVADETINLADIEVLVTTLVVTSNGQTGTFLGDFNCDGMVDVLNDAFILVGNLNNAVMSYSEGDTNLDGTVDVLSDAFVLVGNLGMTNTPPAAP